MTDIALPARRVPFLGVASWALYDWASQPFFTLVTSFLFSSYFANYVAADPDEGAAQWGLATAVAGLAIALFSPIFGSIADAGGPRKPWIATFSLLLVAGSAALWFVVPGTSGSVTIALVAFAIGTVGIEFAFVFINAMMPDLVDEKSLGRLSGIAWATGYIGGLVSLFITLGFFVNLPDSGLTVLGLAPAFGLDPSMFEGFRAAGPYAAIWYVVFALPLFLFTPDAPHRMGLAAAVRTGLNELKTTLLSMRRHANAFRFLLANMIYTDGLIALGVFGPIYASSTFGWSAFELLGFGIVVTITGAIGAFVGGWLDDRIGPKQVVQASLVLFLLASLSILSIDANHVGYLWTVAPPVEGDGLFAATGERVYLGLGALIGAAAGSMWASSRTLLCLVAPRENMTQFFGLFALTGKATSFLAPLAVSQVIAISASQRIGISVLILFFAGGLAVLHGVRPERG